MPPELRASLEAERRILLVRTGLSRPRLARRYPIERLRERIAIAHRALNTLQEALEKGKLPKAWSSIVMAMREASDRDG